MMAEAVAVSLTPSLPPQCGKGAANRRRWSAVTGYTLSESADPGIQLRGYRMQACRRMQIVANPPHTPRTLASYACRDPLCPQCRHARGKKWQKAVIPMLALARHEGLVLDGRDRLYIERSDAQIAAALDLAQTQWRQDPVGENDRPTSQWHRRIRDLTRSCERKAPEKFFLLFVTLTIRNRERIWEESPKGEAVNHLATAIQKPWRKMRETARRRPDSAAGKLWRAVAGGIKVMEITWSAKHQNWHPHLHCILLCRQSYISKEELAQLWSAYADGYIVDVRSIDDEGKAVAELVKYLTKPVLAHHKKAGAATEQIRRMGIPQLTELRKAVAGRRMISTFGVLRGLQSWHRAQAACPDPDDRREAATATLWGWAPRSVTWEPWESISVPVAVNPAALAVAQRWERGQHTKDRARLINPVAWQRWAWMKYYVNWVREHSHDAGREWA